MFFSTAIVNAQANNNCANAILIVSDSTCRAGVSMLLAQSASNPTGQTMFNATYIASQLNGSPSSTCTFVASQDVWYYFVAKSKYPNIAVSNLGTEWGKTNSTLKIQLFSGICGSFTEVACANNTPITLTPLNSPLVIGNTYYIRVHKNNTTVPDVGPGMTPTGSGITWGFTICITDNISKVSRMNEIFSRTYLSGANSLNYPWEITYGQDDSLWITEARGYKVYKMNSIDGGRRVVLDISSTSTQFGTSGTGDDTLYAQNMSSWSGQYGGWPQGGLAGLALHPQFGLGAGKDFVYITYVWKYISGTNPNGVTFRNKLVRFTYNTLTGKLQSPSVLDWNIPGSSDHNSQRLIIAPVIKGGTNFLFMGEGDVGSGQFTNRYRLNNSQSTTSLEGKILRYNLESDGDAGYAAWIPNDNPYSNAVWSIGVRNNQGFAYDTATNLLYGSSHGPFSDDELNIIEKAKNYGHPRVIGFSADGNYNGNTMPGTNTSISAGAPYADCATGWYIPTGYTPPTGMGYTNPYCGQSSLGPIGNEATNASTIGTSYKDPLFSAYPSPPLTIQNIWTPTLTPSNGGWESEGWSGMDLYSNKLIPGWNRSLVSAGLKWGRLIKLNLGTTGTTTMPSNIGGSAGNVGDTITYFQSSNRYRDLAFSPNGKDLFLVMDNSSATSGPGTANPSAAGCPGCVVKYTFLGYATDGTGVGLSTIPKSINITTGLLNNCNAGTSVTIDGTNNNLWVPITGPDGNIMAEINAMGQSLGLVTSSFYKNSGAVRSANGKKYLNRNITISPANTFASPVKVRLYIFKAELDALTADITSGVTSINDLRVLKNNDVCNGVLSSSTTQLTTFNTGTNLDHGSNGHVLQTEVSSFSTFYFAGANIVLPLDVISFNGALQSDLSALLKWRTANEVNTAGFALERGIDGNNFKQIAVVNATGSNNVFNYNYSDNDAVNQQSAIIYYRLKIQDKDGSFKYSHIVVMALPVAKATISIAPNPVVNEVRGTIISPINANVTLRIFDNTGRLMLQTKAFVKKGTNTFLQNINNLASGAYYLDISGNGIISRTQFQKL